MKKECRFLLRKAVDSLVLSIEHFNRPSERGRISAVLILLDHSFEMFLKAAIVHRGGRIWDPKIDMAFGFDKCLQIAYSSGNVKFLTNENADLLRAINTLRDGAQHHYVEVAEQTLYLLTQAGVTLFRDLMLAVFSKDLRLELPERVLPISSTPPVDVATLFDHQVEEIRRLLSPGTRRRFEAEARLRSLAILDGALRGNSNQPGPRTLRRLSDDLKNGRAWDQVFPSVAALKISTDGFGPSINLRITKNQGLPVHLVKEGDPDAVTVASRSVDKSQFYNLSHRQLAEHVELTTSKTTAIIRFLDLQGDPDCYHEFKFGKTRHPRYSQKAIHRIRETLETVSIETIWATHAPGKRA